MSIYIIQCKHIINKQKTKPVSCLCSIIKVSGNMPQKETNIAIKEIMFLVKRETEIIQMSKWKHLKISC